VPEKDPLDQLQEAWAQMDVPAAERDLLEEDSLTQESVAFLQQAWRQVETPQIVLPRLSRLLRILTYVASAAAALLVSALVFFMQPKTPHKDIASPSVMASANELPSAPKLIENNQKEVQVLAGKVRLTMLRKSGISPSAQTNDS